MKWKANKGVRWLCVLAWMGVIFAFSSQAHSGEATKAYLGELNVPIRKSAHMTEYAILFCLTQWATFGTTNSAVARMLAPIILSVGYAATDEYHQSFVPGRSATFSDVLVDSLGALIGWLLSAIYKSFAAKKESDVTSS